MAHPRLLLGSAVLAAALAVIALLRPEPRPYPCRATFEQVRVGMTRGQVESTVGGPPGKYPEDGPFYSHTCDPVFSLFHYDSWEAADGDLRVRFDETGRSIDLRIVDVDRLPPCSLLDHIRAWFGF